jgi:hypothetical protein
MASTKRSTKKKPSKARAKSAPRLADIQREMLDALRRPLMSGDRMQEQSSGTAEKIIAPNDRLTAFERLEIYNQQYWWRLIGAFAEDFPGVCAVIGQRAFDRLTTAYLESCPSRSWTLRNLGSRLVEFLAKHPEFSAPYTTLARDVAAVEWASVTAFDDPEKKPIDPQQMATANPATLRLRVQPYLQLLELHHPVDRLLSKLRKRSADAGAASNAVGAAKVRRAPRIRSRGLRTPLHLAVYRMDNRVYYRRLPPLAHRLLLALRKGATLEAACEAAMEGSTLTPDEAAAQVREAFTLFTTRHWLCGK